jgi:hypothetical protein
MRMVFHLTRSPLPGLLAECPSTRKEPAALPVRPSLGHWPVADSRAQC